MILNFYSLPDSNNNIYTIAIESRLVESVVESSSRPPGHGGYICTCIITMASGDKLTTTDQKRDTIRRIEMAKEQE